MIGPVLQVAGFDGGEKFDGFEGLSAFVLALAVVAFVAWLAVFAVRWLLSSPRLPDAEPATDELGPESPAIANLLVNRWKVTRAAVQATLLDLAARRALGIDMLSREHFVVRLRDTTDEKALTAYERQVLHLVQQRATGGSAPVEALALGEEDEAERFWQRFTKAVVSEARNAGLARSRWSRADWLVLGGALLAVLELFALAFGLAHLLESTGGGGDDFGRWDWFMVAAFVWLLLLAAASQMKAIRETPAGKAACARWLGVRTFLRNASAFDEAPPASVVIWERMLAYGAALGVAHEAVERLPLREEDPDTAWSRVTGSWRQLRVEYPSRFGFGRKPSSVFLEGLGLSAFWGLIAFVALPLLAQGAWEIATSAIDEGPSGEERSLVWLVLGFAAFFAVAGVYVLANFLRGLVRLVRGGLDLGKTRIEQGTIVKVHAGRFAIDDGVGDEVCAWTPPPAAPALGRGMKVRVRRSPHLQYVSAVEVLEDAPFARDAEEQQEAAAQPPGGPQTPLPAGLGLTAVRVATIAGRPMREANPREVSGRIPATAAPLGAVQAFVDEGGGHVAAVLFTLPGFAARLAARGGDGERWLNGRMLMERRGASILQVDVDLANTTPEQRRAIAEAVAAEVLAAPPAVATS